MRSSKDMRHAYVRGSMPQKVCENRCKLSSIALHDVAGAVGVSIKIVSRVLNITTSR